MRDVIRSQLEGRKPTAQGTLKNTPLVHLLVYALDQQLSGSTLLVAPDGGMHVIYFQDGVPSKVRTSGMVSPLDRVLLEMGLADESVLQDSLRTISRSKNQLHGQYLIEQGHLDQATLEASLSWQLVRKGSFMLKLPAETRYAYYDGFNLLDGYGGPELTPCEPLALIMTGVRLRARDPLVEQTLRRLGELPLALHPQADVTRLSLKDHEKRVVELMRSKAMSLASLIAHRVAQEPVVKLTVYALAITRSLNLGGKGKPPVGHQQRVAVPAPPSSTPRPPARKTSMGVGPDDTGYHAAPPPSQRRPARPPPPTRQPPSQLGGASRQPAQPRPAAATGRPPPRRQQSSGGLPRRGRSTGRSTGPEETPSREQMARALATAAAPRRSRSTGQTPTARQGPTREDVERRAAAIDDQNFFEILGVNQSATPEYVQSAYFTLAKTWHPDRLPDDLGDLRSTVAKLFSRFNEAYQTLSDPTRRDDYLRLLSSGGGTARDAEMVERVVDSALLFQKGEVLFKKGSLASAEAMVSQAVEADPAQPEYVALLAWIQAQRSGPLPEDDGARRRHHAQQIKMLSQVIEVEPEYERALFYRAELLKRSGFGDRALRDYRACMRLNPRNIDAAREVRLADKREKKDGGSLLGRLFGKKDS